MQPPDLDGLRAQRFAVTQEDRSDSLMRAVTRIRNAEHPSCITLWQDRRTGLYHTRGLSHEAEQEAKQNDWRYLGTGDELDDGLLAGRGQEG